MTRSRRYEFSKEVKREALRRSGGRCEASSEVYGLDPHQRCYTDLGKGVEFDHYPIPATEPGSDSLENCVAVCLGCHRFKTGTFDIPVQAKVKRTSDKHRGIAKSSRPLGRGNHQHTATRAIVRARDIHADIEGDSP